MNLAIGILTSGGYQYFMPNEFVWSFYALHSHLLRGKTPATGIRLIRSQKFPTDVARNDVCLEFLRTDADRLLFLDADQTFAPEAIERLLRSEADIITGRYHVKRPPYHPNLYVVPREPHQPGTYKRVHYGRGVFEVDRCGAGALLVKRHVIEQIGFPWFRYGVDPNEPHDLAISEDFFFCERAQQQGFHIMADWEAELGHATMGTVTGDWSTSYLQPMEDEIPDRPDLLDHLVCCGYPEGYRLPSGHVIPPYERDHRGSVS